MYTSGLNAYVGGKWFQCSAFLEKAIQERKSYKTVIVDCRLRCRSNSVLSDFFIPADLNTSVDALRLNFFENLVKESHCLKTCKTEKLGYQISENRVLLEVEEDFDNLKPYSYLQFCYYKLERYTDAACAAYTYFLRNPGDEDTVANIHSYRHDFKVKDEDFKDLEKNLIRIKGENAYDQDDWTNAIELIELAITEYYKEEERCRVECEGHFDHQSFPDFIQAIADHYISVLQCQFKCERKLSILYKDYLPDFVGQHYNFLQFAYHQNGNNDKAVECAGTYLLFNPHDEEMLRNKAFYMQKLGYHEAHFVPRQMNSTKSKPEKLTKKHYMAIYEKIGIKVKEEKMTDLLLMIFTDKTNVENLQILQICLYPMAMSSDDIHSFPSSLSMQSSILEWEISLLWSVY
ncbi:P3H1 [Mytilus edulis]|uniref:P3H1 n=1 Tax=Mytilus edulis TaxID=6550 RepID=A0A8S3T0F0_MYTED|nr:P3H1 [Mytilus edulis]